MWSASHKLAAPASADLLFHADTVDVQAVLIHAPRPVFL